MIDSIIKWYFFAGLVCSIGILIKIFYGLSGANKKTLHIIRVLNDAKLEFGQGIYWACIVLVITAHTVHAFLLWPTHVVDRFKKTAKTNS